ncbi:hypothetical protein BDQ12DRAFT_118082 [Crucibulum laeve]|uniref:Uncharacterized protein n=1 Tax=Crucibulum laeve TaxID=68775 RepID=A0A5C3LFU4_9AGAR|nr:hypothetical protein BDQ12DRAFT_118082 [Crucibulum laeve]
MIDTWVSAIARNPRSCTLDKCSNYIDPHRTSYPTQKKEIDSFDVCSLHYACIVIFLVYVGIFSSEIPLDYRNQRHCSQYKLQYSNDLAIRQLIGVGGHCAEILSFDAVLIGSCLYGPKRLSSKHRVNTLPNLQVAHHIDRSNRRSKAL